MTLIYSRSTYSSSSKDQYDARGEVPGTTIDVSIEKLGEIGEPVEGRFSALVANSNGESVSITNGTFCVIRSVAAVTKQGALNTKP